MFLTGATGFDYLADRIRTWPGELREPRFGLPELDFRRLCDQVDAVYHLAAELDVLAPYAALREASTRGFGTVLELALRRRVKHVFYASAMAVFPQYFCDFASGFASHVIEEGGQPDPGLMKSVFPPGRRGTRGASSSSSRPCCPPSPLACRPRTEPVPAVSEILTAISLNPRRRHTICHLRPPAPLTWGPEAAGSGLREVSYAEFKRACQARGPLHGHWPLVDRLAGYWFSGAPQARPAEGLAD